MVLLETYNGHGDGKSSVPKRRRTFETTSTPSEKRFSEDSRGFFPTLYSRGVHFGRCVSLARPCTLCTPLCLRGIALKFAAPSSRIISSTTCPRHSTDTEVSSYPTPYHPSAHYLAIAPCRPPTIVYFRRVFIFFFCSRDGRVSKTGFFYRLHFPLVPVYGRRPIP